MAYRVLRLSAETFATGFPASGGRFSCQRVISPALNLDDRPRYRDGANGAALGDWGLKTGVDY
jgi:hypothetical protein